MNSNKLVINPDKTHLMVMGSRKHAAKRKEVSLLAEGFVIKPSETEKLLGGQLHQVLNGINIFEITRGPCLGS